MRGRRPGVLAQVPVHGSLAGPTPGARRADVFSPLGPRRSPSAGRSLGLRSSSRSLADRRLSGVDKKRQLLLPAGLGRQLLVAGWSPDFGPPGLLQVGGSPESERRGSFCCQLTLVGNSSWPFGHRTSVHPVYCRPAAPRSRKEGVASATSRLWSATHRGRRVAGLRSTNRSLWAGGSPESEARAAAAARKRRDPAPDGARLAPPGECTESPGPGVDPHAQGRGAP